MSYIATFSIVAFDPQRQEWGVAVQSKFLAAAAVVSWAQAGAGAVATQSHANVTYGARGLALMTASVSAEETIAQLIAADPQRARRQVGMVDKNGRAAAYTGKECYAWAGHHIGAGFACQGNILVPGTVEAMAARFEAVRNGPGELADWLVEALAAGQAAGGDKRGRQAAGVLVVRAGGGYGGDNDRYLDLRVDDDPSPVQRLAGLVQMHHLFFGRSQSGERIIIDSALAREIQAMLAAQGMYAGIPDGSYDEKTQQAFAQFIGRENLEDRCDPLAGWIDPPALEFLRKHFLR